VLCEYKVIEGSAGGAVSNRGPKPASGIPLMGDKLGVLEVQPLKFHVGTSFLQGGEDVSSL